MLELNRPKLVFNKSEIELRQKALCLWQKEQEMEYFEFSKEMYWKVEF